MVEPLSAQIMDQLSQVVGLYHRLVLVVAPSGAGKTAALRDIAAQTNSHYINVNLELRARFQSIVEVTREVADRYGTLVAQVPPGQHIGQNDSWIAVITLTHNLVLIKYPCKSFLISFSVSSQYFQGEHRFLYQRIYGRVLTNNPDFDRIQGLPKENWLV